MVNIIDRNQPAGITAYTSQTSRVRRNENASFSQAISGSCEDRVLLSPAAKEIQMAKNQLQNIPDVRFEKVAEIKNQLAQGSYSVPSETIAHRLMGESLMNELLS
jgi:negative regulator of flagellin synthesis FlgM